MFSGSVPVSWRAVTLSISMLYYGMFCSRRQSRSGQAQVHSAGREHDKIFHIGEGKGIMLSQSVLISIGILELHPPKSLREHSGLCYAKFLFLHCRVGKCNTVKIPVFIRKTVVG